MAISDAPRASSALSTMKPTSPATASAISSGLSYSHHSTSIMSEPLPVSHLRCNRFAAFIQRRAVDEARGDEAAGHLVGLRIAAGLIGPAIRHPPIRLDREDDEGAAAARPPPAKLGGV